MSRSDVVIDHMGLPTHKDEIAILMAMRKHSHDLTEEEEQACDDWVQARAARIRELHSEGLEQSEFRERLGWEPGGRGPRSMQYVSSGLRFLDVLRLTRGGTSIKDTCNALGLTREEVLQEGASTRCKQ